MKKKLKHPNWNELNASLSLEISSSQQSLIGGEERNWCYNVNDLNGFDNVYMQGSNGVEAYFTVDGDEDQAVVVRAKLLVGADGMHSVIRKQMIGDDARYLSLVDWNCVILNPDLR